MMNKSQKKAIEIFEKGYLAINASRRTGKTTVLKEIIKRNKDKKILLIVKHKNMAEEYKDVDIIDMDKEISFNIMKDYDIILGDEVFIPKTAFAMTGCNNFNHTLNGSTY